MWTSCSNSRSHPTGAYLAAVRVPNFATANFRVQPELPGVVTVWNLGSETVAWEEKIAQGHRVGCVSSRWQADCAGRSRTRLSIRNAKDGKGARELIIPSSGERIGWVGQPINVACLAFSPTACALPPLVETSSPSGTCLPVTASIHPGLGRAARVHRRRTAAHRRFQPQNACIRRRPAVMRAGRLLTSRRSEPGRFGGRGGDQSEASTDRRGSSRRRPAHPGDAARTAGASTDR